MAMKPTVPMKRKREEPQIKGLISLQVNCKNVSLQGGKRLYSSIHMPISYHEMPFLSAQA